MRGGIPGSKIHEKTKQQLKELIDNLKEKLNADLKNIEIKDDKRVKDPKKFDVADIEILCQSYLNAVL